VASVPRNTLKESSQTSPHRMRETEALDRLAKKPLSLVREPRLSTPAERI
jgi:hypothetical protein